MTAKLQRLFRNVPPRLYLAMVATEQNEKYQRRKLMEKIKFSELEVVEYIAEEMIKLGIKDKLDE